MTKTAPQVVASYLNQLESALVGVPDDVRAEILAGVREELTGLDAATAAVRIDELGDPALIAAEARAGASESPAAAERPATDWMAVIAALVLAVGSILVPVLGFIAGVVLVWASRAWRTSDKLIATLAGPVIGLVIVLVAFIVRAVNPPDSIPGAGVNPLLPAMHDIVWSTALVVVGVTALAGFWLLWRLGRAPGAAPAAASGYSVVTGLVVAFGGIPVPVLGWVAGIAMMWFSRAWWAWEKWVVTVTPIAAALLANLVLWWVATARGEPGESSIEVFGIPVVFGGVAPLTVAMIAIAATALSGFWLILRARRAPRPQP